MNSIILCEGATDFTLLQYYMRRVYSWEDRGKESTKLLYRFNKEKGERSRRFYRGNNTITIASVGGVSNLKAALADVLKRNSAQGYGGEVFSRFVIFTDHDEQWTADIWKVEIEKELSGNDVTFSSNGLLFDCVQKNDMDEQISFQIEILLIPENHTGALETFLLDSIKAEDAYDAAIISKGHDFVENADPEERYLKHRRDKIKAEFDVYFSVRTTAKQFTERQDILKNIPWENFSLMNEQFRILGEL